MNLPQRIILALGALAIAGMALFPPWLFVLQYPDLRIERFAGYYPIWRSNTPTDLRALNEMFQVSGSMGHLMFYSIKVDTTRLYIQIAAVLLVTILLTILFRRKA